jgi:hypothetical protein
MSCRCGDISRYEGYINTLNDALSIVSSSDGYFKHISDRQGSIMNTYSSAFESAQMETLRSNTETLDDDMVNVKNSIYNRISNRKNQMSDELSNMRSEDHDHHEEERRRQEEENE